MCSNVDDEVSRGQEIQRMTCIACSGVDDVGINVKLSRDSKAKGFKESEGRGAPQRDMLFAQVLVSYL